jgi:hypothetical protein
METSNCTCTKCRQTKPFNEFLRLGVKGNIKQFRTCNDCHNKMAECQEAKKRQLEINENEDQENEDRENNELEIIEPINFCDHIEQLLNIYSMQHNDDLDNASPFQLQCGIDISTFDNSEKEMVEELVESIEDVDEFSWMYVLFLM